ncbi:conserved hypothetical protein [Neospora caninum Liverpool]|uniref:Uncharacterized protein n=1 Tax=Neospora caninum (strain Liverpool) TaxID=572307 RepID=F0VEW4_NEOCL|nr:conserved hypothetical protein [Neospora caninum Liverpool]CBZ52258.1 conserved hypothetical protein [Neospora caninum Liverpool]CEL66226.1 TPA: hypothetical protein BN1204_020450 [Neospora caninum Liverpool]|eukprot:XP_003882290.1 conserved hypothetical protein [Neospora caninum Liverpool]
MRAVRTSRFFFAGAVVALVATSAHGSENEAPPESQEGAAPTLKNPLFGQFPLDDLQALLDAQKDNMDAATLGNMLTVVNEVNSPDMKEFIRLLQSEDSASKDSILNHPLMQKKLQVAETIAAMLESLTRSSEMTDDKAEEIGRSLAEKSALLVQGQMTLEQFAKTVAEEKADLEQREEDEEDLQEAEAQEADATEMVNI